MVLLRADWEGLIELSALTNYTVIIAKKTGLVRAAGNFLPMKKRIVGAFSKFWQFNFVEARILLKTTELVNSILQTATAIFMLFIFGSCTFPKFFRVNFELFRKSYKCPLSSLYWIWGVTVDRYLDRIDQKLARSI